MATTENRLSDYLKNNYQVKDNVVVVKTTLNNLSEALDLSTRTVQRRLSQMEEDGFVVVENKRGAKGGYAIQLNPDAFNIKQDSSNPYTNPTEADISLIHELFPSRGRVLKGTRRTKEEMAIYRAEQVRMTERETELNKQLEDSMYGSSQGFKPNITGEARMTDISWEWFKQLDDPKQALKAYIAGMAFNEFSRVYDEHYVELYQQDKANAIPAGQRHGYPHIFHLATFSVLKGGFLGTRNWKVAQRLVELSEHYGVSPIIFIGKIFENDFFYHDTHPEKPCRLPFFNEMSNSKAIETFERSLRNQAETFRKYGRVTTTFLGSLALQEMEKNYVTIDQDLDTYSDHIQFSIYDPSSRSYDHYVKDTLQKASEKLAPDEMTTLHTFLDEQFELITAHDMSSFTSSEPFAFAMLRANQIVKEDLAKVEEVDGDTKEVFAGMLSMFAPDPATYGYLLMDDGVTWIKGASEHVVTYDNDLMIKNMEKVFFTHTRDAGSRDVRNVTRLVKETQAKYTNFDHVKEVLNKVKDLVPLTPYGLLNRAELRANY